MFHSENVVHLMIMLINCQHWQCRTEYKTGPETAAQKLRKTLVGVQTGCIEDTKGWMVRVD